MNLKRLLPLLIVPLLLTACPSGANRTKNGPDLRNLPREIRSGEQGPFHVQGIAVDLERGYIYFSFTTKLLKMDFEGNLIGSVDGMTGHLGCLTMNPADGRVYGSLEYKDDAIGKGIRRTLDAGQVAPEDEKDRTGFYVAIFDVDRITRPDMDAEKDRVMTTVYIKEAVDDYFATAENGGRTVEHRFGCSGIDGVTFAPRFGAKEGGDYLYVAYGVYGDTLRTDNDYQVLLAYDTKDWKRFEQPLSQGSLHKSGPAAPDHKYFVRTGNTSWGIQNLAYDPASGNCYAAVYKGKKSQYPNYSLFVIDGGKPARRELLQGFDTGSRREIGRRHLRVGFQMGNDGTVSARRRLFLYFAERPFEGDQTAEQHRSPLSVDRRCGCPLPAGRIAPLRLCHAPGRSQERPGVFLSAA